jgi:imidazolonepropionase
MSDPGIVEGGSVAVKDGRITFVGPIHDSDLVADEVLDATGKVVMPGFVDSHTHLVFAGSREDEFAMRLAGDSYIEIANKGGGIKSTVRSTRKASVDELVGLARERLDEMLRWGTTTAEVKSGYGLDTENEIKILEAVRKLDREHPADLIPTYLGAHDFPEEFAEDREEYVEKVVNDIPEVARRGLARFCDVFCEEGFYTVPQSRRILKAGLAHGLSPKLHADELRPSGGAELAAELEAVSADHLVCPSETGLTRMKGSGTIAVLLPGTSFFLRKDAAPGRKMVSMGIPIAIASDYNPGSSPVNHMPLCVGLACLLYGFSPAESLAAATVNGAWAVGMGRETGSLEVGKMADLLILDAASYLEVPYWFGRNPVEKVIKAGRIII